MNQTVRRRPGGALISLAAVVVIIAGMRAAADVLTCGLGLQNHPDIISAFVCRVHRTAQNVRAEPAGIG